MISQINLYISSIFVTFLLTGFLAWYAWKHRQVPGTRAYAALAFAECLLALSELLSIFSASMSGALFWFRTRYILGALIAVFWLVFALQYSGRREWISKRLLAGLFFIPFVTQILHWSNHLHGLWVNREATLHRNGNLWIADISTRIPDIAYLIHMFYALFLTLAGITVILLTTWKMRREFIGQAMLLAGAGLTTLLFAVNSLFNLLPKTDFNVFTPGIGLSVLLIALAVFRFDFLKYAPMKEAPRSAEKFDDLEKRSLAVFIAIFILFASGIAAVSYATYQNYQQQFRAEVEEQLSSIAELKVSGLENWRAERMGDAEVIHNSPAFAALAHRFIGNPNDLEAKAQLQAWLDALHNSYRYDRVSLLDVAGGERLSSPATPEAVDLHMVEDLPAVFESGKVAFLGFHRHATDNTIHLGLLVPIYADNRPLAMLVLRIDPNDYLYPYLQRWPVPSESAETLLVRREGNDVLFLNKLRFQEDAALNLSISLQNEDVPAVKAMMGGTGVVEGMDYRGIPVIADIRAVPNSPWFLISKMDTTEMYAPLWTRLWQTLLFFGALILSVGVGLMLVWRQQRIHYYRRQVKAAQALHASEEKFRLAFDTSPDSIAITRLSDGMFVSVNKGFEDITGYSRNQVVGKTSSEINIWKNPEDRQRVVEELRAKGEVRNYEAPFLTPSGERYGLMSAAIVELNGVSHILNITHDITERKRMEEALKVERELMKTLMDTVPVQIYFKDAQSRFIRINNAQARLFGLSDPEQAVGKTDFDFFSAEHAQQAFDDEREIIRTGQPMIKEEREAWDNRPDRWISTTKLPLRDKDENIIGTFGISMDITERKQAEEALRESEAFTKTILDNLPVGIAVNSVEPTVDFSYMNANFAKFYRTTEEKLVDPNAFWSAVYEEPEFREAMKRKVLDDAASGDLERMVWVDIPITRKGEATTYITARNIPVPGKPLMISTVWDVTEIKQAREALQEYNTRLETEVEQRTRELRDAQEQLVRQERLATLGQLAGGVGHELRNPLGVISNAIYYLKLIQPDANDKVCEYLNIIEKEIHASNKIVTDLLDFTRIKSIDRRPVSVSELVDQTLERYSIHPSVKRLVKLPTDLPQIYADPQHVIQVLVNLVANACQAIVVEKSNTGLLNAGKLTITAAAENDMIRIDVQDTGTGISPENMKRLFEPLFTTKTKGIGLGLAVSRKLIEANGGRIEVQSELGIGTTFTVYLPIKQ